VIIQPSGRFWPRRLTRDVALCILWFASVFVVASRAEETPEFERKHRGVSYSHDEVRDLPWSIHVLKVDRSRGDYEFHTTVARSNGLSLGTMTEQTKTVPMELGKPIAGINGDFWKSGIYDGDPEGLQIARGELVSAPGERSCFWIDREGRPQATNVISQLKVTWPNSAVTLVGLNEERTNGATVLYTSAVGPTTRTKQCRELILERGEGADWLPLRAGHDYVARVREVRETGNCAVAPDTLVLSLSSQLQGRIPDLSTGTVLRISTATVPSLRGVQTAIGGGPALVRNGKMATFTSAPVRHPRTALGWNDGFYFLVVVDGRQPSLSIGMTLQELAAYMIKLGCQTAINLDGGGSATFWAYGNVMNSPCYGHERPMANALVLVQKPPDAQAASSP